MPRRICKERTLAPGGATVTTPGDLLRRVAGISEEALVKSSVWSEKGGNRDTSMSFPTLLKSELLFLYYSDGSRLKFKFV